MVLNKNEKRVVQVGAVVASAGVVTNVVGNLVVSQIAFNAAAVKAGAILGTTHAITPAVIAAGQAATFTGVVAVAAKLAMVGGVLMVAGGFLSGFRDQLKVELSK